VVRETEIVATQKTNESINRKGSWQTFYVMLNGQKSVDAFHELFPGEPIAILAGSECVVCCYFTA
jgi:hypothetical protein